MFCSQDHPSISPKVLHCTHFHDFTFSNLHVDMVSPPCQGQPSGQGVSGGRGPLHSRLPTHLPRRLPGDQGLARGCLQGGPQVGRVCTDLGCPAPRMGRASWALLREIQDGDQNMDLQQEQGAWSSGVTRSDMGERHRMPP